MCWWTLQKKTGKPAHVSQFVELRIGAFMNYIKLKLHPPFIALSTASGGTEGEGQLGGFAPKPLFALSLFGSAFARLGAWGRKPPMFLSPQCRRRRCWGHAGRWYLTAVASIWCADGPFRKKQGSPLMCPNLWNCESGLLW